MVVEKFAEFGRIQEVRWGHDGRFCHIDYVDETSVDGAVALNNVVWEKSVLRVDFAVGGHVSFSRELTSGVHGWHADDHFRFESWFHAHGSSPLPVYAVPPPLMLHYQTQQYYAGHAHHAPVPPPPAGYSGNSSSGSSVSRSRSRSERRRSYRTQNGQHAHFSVPFGSVYDGRPPPPPPLPSYDLLRRAPKTGESSSSSSSSDSEVSSDSDVPASRDRPARDPGTGSAYAGGYAPRLVAAHSLTLS
mmetsp:Transcript_97368/g.223134  ORF Transcript_97368/g.223134 Transcript_97368/m.223134 type:complete len:246 (-) Transcript_97368:67-804(-)